MTKKLPALALSFCLVVISAPYHAQADSSRSGDCDYSCQKRKEAEALAIIYGGMLVIAVTVGTAYLLIRGDDGESELASGTQMVDSQRLRLVPYSDPSGSHGLDLEYPLSDDATIGLRTRYGPKNGEALNGDDSSYFGGIFYRLSF